MKKIKLLLVIISSLFLIPFFVDRTRAEVTVTTCKQLTDGTQIGECSTPTVTQIPLEQTPIPTVISQPILSPTAIPTVTPTSTNNNCSCTCEK